jgi:hypothetical protein
MQRNKMKNFPICKILILGILCLFCFNLSTEAQKRRPRSGGKSTARKVAPKFDPIALKEGSQKVADEIKALSRFLYLLGGSLPAIQQFDADVKSGKISGAARTQAEAGRKGLIQTITIFKNELVGLEEKFRSNPVYKTYLPDIAGVGELAATAEQQAQSNQFDAAGRTLLQVLSQLTDTLQSMP